MDRSCSAPHPPLIREAAPQGKLEIMGKTDFSWPELEDVHHVWTHPEVDLSNQDWWGHKLHNYWCVELKPCLVVSFKRFQTDWLHQRWREYSITSELLSSPNSALQHMPASIFRKEIPEQFASNLLLKKVLENPAMKISPHFLHDVPIPNPSDFLAPALASEGCSTLEHCSEPGAEDINQHGFAKSYAISLGIMMDHTWSWWIWCWQLTTCDFLLRPHVNNLSHPHQRTQDPHAFLLLVWLRFLSWFV